MRLYRVGNAFVRTQAEARELLRASGERHHVAAAAAAAAVDVPTDQEGLARFLSELLTGPEPAPLRAPTVDEARGFVRRAQAAQAAVDAAGMGPPDRYCALCRAAFPADGA